MGQVRWKVFVQHTILANLPSTYQNLLKFVKIWRSSDRNKNAQFFETWCRFILIFHQMAVIFFYKSTHRFHPVKFWVGLFTQKMKMQFFINDDIYRHRVCKQSTTDFSLLMFYWHRLWRLVGPANGKIVLRQTSHADAREQGLGVKITVCTKSLSGVVLSGRNREHLSASMRLSNLHWFQYVSVLISSWL